MSNLHLQIMIQAHLKTGEQKAENFVMRHRQTCRAFESLTAGSNIGIITNQYMLFTHR